MSDTDNTAQHDTEHFIADDGHCTKCRHDVAFEQLDRAIDACVRVSGCDGVAVDAVLIVGLQHVEDDGSRTGHVEVYPRSGAQPSYITRGLISEGTALLDAIYAKGLDDDQ
ncbi:DUF7213 family protein [Mycolicibacterium komossense]|uniref:Uncharacterized protein n=1 Tax=Mycolicibacterium komossense TaxID=1779 RepID=A0ABT3C9D7_9MYCO|nr:hypothetical protein [Mycolicibacterium komossense]MCV7226073.1 hypothetical protein [Mycolicibacterium komossense]